MSKPKRPRDANQLAKFITDLVAREITEKKPSKHATVKRKAGVKGGAARAKKLTAAQRKEIAQKAAAKRWGKED